MVGETMVDLMKIDSNLLLRNIKDEESDYKNISKWYENPHVYKYFEQRTLAYKEVVKKYKKRTKINCPIKTKIIVYKDIPIGLIQFYNMSLKEKAIFDLAKYSKVVGVDIFIGDDNYCNLGIGTTVMKYVSDYLLNYVNLIAVVPEACNKNAIRCYEKSGFIKQREVVYSNTIGEETINLLMLKHKINS